MFRKAINYFKRYWLIILLGALTAFLGFLWFTRPGGKPAPRPTLQPTSLPVSQRGVVTVRFDRSFSLPAEQAPSYSLSKLSLSASDTLRVARTLGFTSSPTIREDPVVGEFYSWSERNKSLLVGLEAGSISFIANLFQTPPPQTDPLPSPKEAQDKVLSLLAQLGLPPGEVSLSPQRTEYQVFDGARFLSSSEEEAWFIETSFSPRIDSGLFILPKTPVFPVIARVTFGNEIYSLTYEFPIREVGAEEQELLKNLEQVRQSLSAGKILEIEGSYEGSSLLSLSDILLQKARLVYPIDTQTGVASPHFLLSGIATLRSGETREINILLPAGLP